MTISSSRTVQTFLRIGYVRTVMLRVVLPTTMILLGPGCATSKKEVRGAHSEAPAVQSAEFRQEVGAVLGPPFVNGNRLLTLNNGDQIFPAMLGAIRTARRSITFESFVFYKGEVPQQFADALAERARAGVRVHVILDGVGASKSRRYHSMLRDAGVELVMFHPHWLHANPFRINNRTHRKLLIVDGKVGFIGGVGIGDEWTGNAQSPEHWHDLHYQVEGPVVAQLQGAFMDHWLPAKKGLLSGTDYFPPLRGVGNTAANVFYSAPEHGNRNVEIMVELAVNGSRQSLLIENSYFVPDKDTVEALVQAARRGVKIQIIVPGEEIDQPKVRRASRRTWRRLLDAGVEIYEYQGTMTHCKLLIVDGLFVSVGSANLDYRALRLNSETNLNVLDRRFASEQTTVFRADLRRSRRVTPGELKGLAEAPMTAVEAPLTPQL